MLACCSLLCVTPTIYSMLQSQGYCCSLLATSKTERGFGIFVRAECLRTCELSTCYEVIGRRQLMTPYCSPGVSSTVSVSPNPLYICTRTPAGATTCQMWTSKWRRGPRPKSNASRAEVHHLPPPPRPLLLEPSRSLPRSRRMDPTNLSQSLLRSQRRANLPPPGGCATPTHARTVDLVPRTPAGATCARARRVTEGWLASTPPLVSYAYSRDQS